MMKIVLSQLSYGGRLMEMQYRDLFGDIMLERCFYEASVKAKLDESRPITLEERRCIIQPVYAIARSGKQFIFHGVFFPEFNSGKMSVHPRLTKARLVRAGFPRDSIFVLSAFARHIEAEYGKTGVVNPNLKKHWREMFDKHLRKYFRFKKTHFGTYVHATAHTYISGLPDEEQFLGTIQYGYVPECETLFPLKHHFGQLTPSAAGFRYDAKRIILNRVLGMCVLEAHFHKLFHD